MQADRLLLACGDQAMLYVNARSSKVGKQTPSALYVHRSAMAEIQPGATVRAADRARWRRTALALAWATIAWNSLEAIIAIASGAEAGSIALVGFGLNSIVEVGSAIVVVWQFSGADVEREQRGGLWPEMGWRFQFGERLAAVNPARQRRFLYRPAVL